MPIISFIKNKTPIEAPLEANLMQTLLAAKIPVASSCHGDGVCSKCVVTVLKGEENLSPRNLTEINLAERNHLNKNQRVSCQTQLNGDVTLDTGYW